LQKKTRSLLDELDSLLIHRDRENLIESRATHIIQGAINLINTIRESYDADVADEMERRFINSIRGQDPAKFTRGLKRITNENKRNNQ
jgi:hypothetical protein